MRSPKVQSFASTIYSKKLGRWW